jgi:hypothetical protein
MPFFFYLAYGEGQISSTASGIFLPERATKYT